MSEIHWAFILASYLLCFGLIAVIILAIVIDHRRLQRDLARLGAADRGGVRETRG
ncbi:MAG: heme exporter protein CcmD [Beijerinckiaceae bacterium]|jgi:heme exporter protein CcmD|nr:heme exporter protein CcmD [Beijerinckiaceae bacterium]